MTTPVIAFEHVGKSFMAAGEGLDDVSLDVAEGEFLAIVGGPAPARPRCCGW